MLGGVLSDDIFRLSSDKFPYRLCNQHRGLRFLLFQKAMFLSKNVSCSNRYKDEYFLIHFDNDTLN